MSNRSIVVLTVIGLLAAAATLWGCSVWLAYGKTEALVDYSTSDFTNTLGNCCCFSLQVAANGAASRLGSARATDAETLRSMARELLVDEISVAGSDGRVLGTSAEPGADGEIKLFRDLEQPFPDGSGFVRVVMYGQSVFSRFYLSSQNLLNDWYVGETGYYLIFDRRTGRLVNEPAGHPEMKGMDVSEVWVDGKQMDMERLHALRDRKLGYVSVRGQWSDGKVLSLPNFIIVVVLPRDEFYDNAYFVFCAEVLILLALASVFLWVILKMRHNAETLERLRREEDAQREKDMAMAKSIQRHALPSEFPPYPELAPIIDLYAIMRAAREVGGDFYDFGYVGGNRFSILIADVSGKGIPGAMFMMRAKSTLKSLIAAGRPLAETVTEVNARLCEGNTDGLFVTAWIGVVNLADGTVEYVNAGHNPPLVKRADGTIRWVEDEPDLPLAAMDGVAYESHRMRLGLGDMLVLYTDGVTEASDGHGGFSGESRLEAAVRAVSGSARSMCDGIRVSVDTFAGAAPQTDDITVLSFGFNGARRVFPASEEGIRRSAAFVGKFGLGPDAAVVVDEIVSNIVRCSGTSEFSIEVRRGGTFVFADDGVEFNPLLCDAPDVEAGADERKVGGLGVFVARHLAREMKYERRNGKNVLTVTLG